MGVNRKPKIRKHMSALKEGQIILPNVRCGYIKVWKAETMKNDPNSAPRFGLLAYLPKEDEKTKAKIDKEIKRLSDAHFKGQKPKSSMLFIKDGDGEDGDENSAGHWLLSINRQERQGRPQVIDQNRKAVLPEDGLIVAGYRYNVLMGIYAQVKWGRIAASLEVLQFWKKDDTFGAAPIDVDDVMPALTEDEEFEA